MQFVFDSLSTELGKVHDAFQSLNENNDFTHSVHNYFGKTKKIFNLHGFFSEAKIRAKEHLFPDKKVPILHY